ncbi:peptidase S8/S53 domain-containing protein [Mycena leptocephala]|nr:peptidase S8/S53 domain-containing protein [Mycena leptocephala]
MLLKSLTNLILVLAAVRAEYQVLEKRDNPPDGFSRIGSSPADKILSLRLALAQNDISGLHDTVYDYLSQEEVESFVVPSEDTVSQVNSWLESHNLTSSPITAAGDWIAVNMTLSCRQGNQVPLPLQFPPTAKLVGHLHVSKSFMASPPTSAKPAANVLGVSGFDNDFANKRDLKAFLEEFRPDMNPNTTFDLISIDSVVNTFTGLESQTSPQIAQSICDAYAQLAARGVTYIVDTGIWWYTLRVTAVGATEFTPDETTETASSLSGGGFSNYFKRPKFQDAVVPAYLKAIDASSSAPFNVSSRGGASIIIDLNVCRTETIQQFLSVPDVSAISKAPFIIEGDLIDFASTTAFSANIFATMVSLLTNERIAAKKPGLGWLNPLIYQNPAAFKDLATGLTHACNDIGFNSTVGWDPVTGLGSPSYTKLQEVCSKL